MRKLALPLMAVCALFAISAPSAVAAESTNVKQFKQIGKVRSAIKGLKAAIKVIQDIDKGQTAAVNDNQGKLDAVSGRVNSILEGVPAIVNGLTALKTGLESAGAGLVQLKAGLEAAGAGLTAVQAALQNPTTGLVGLNNARPQFGAFSGAGTILGSTGLSGGSGPTNNATKGSSGPPDIDGLYVVDFGNNVSTRMYTINVFPYGPTSLGGGGAAPTASATNCASSTTAAGICGAVGGVSSDSSPNHVLVQVGDGSSGGAANGFSITAISG